MLKRRWRTIGLATLALFAAAAWGVYALLPYAGETRSGLATATLNAPAPNFTLPGADGKPHSLTDYRGKTVVLEWTSAICEFTARKYQYGSIQAFEKATVADGVAWLQISSAPAGSSSYLTAAAAQALIAARGLTITGLLLDDSGAAGKSYGARATPTVAIIDKAGVLRYYGAFDDAPWSDFATAGRRYAASALQAVAAGKPPEPAKTAAYGCFIPYGDL